MTKIQITPDYKDVKPQGFYVYLHRRATDSEVFYVGKGKGIRAWRINRGYNTYWTRVARKHGVVVEIYQDNLSEEEAFREECKVINELIEGGTVLTNLTNGGEGQSGYRKRPVYCSNGMVFNGITDAIEWVRENVNPRASSGSIWSCCAGVQKTACGYTWSYEDDCEEYVSQGLRRGLSQRKKVYCSNGMNFPSLLDAAEWLTENGWPKARSSSISSCCIGTYGTAYGFGWSFTDENVTYTNPIRAASRKRGVKVMRSDGVVFDSMKEASESVTKGTIDGVCGVCRGRNKTHAGYGWEYM